MCHHHETEEWATLLEEEEETETEPEKRAEPAAPTVDD